MSTTPTISTTKNALLTVAATISLLSIAGKRQKHVTKALHTNFTRIAKYTQRPITLKTKTPLFHQQQATFSSIPRTLPQTHTPRPQASLFNSARPIIPHKSTTPHYSLSRSLQTHKSTIKSAFPANSSHLAELKLATTQSTQQHAKNLILHPDLTSRFSHTATALAGGTAVFLTATDEHGNIVFQDQKVELPVETIHSSSLQQQFAINGGCSDSETDDEDQQVIVMGYSSKTSEITSVSLQNKKRYVGLDLSKSLTTSTSSSDVTSSSDIEYAQDNRNYPRPLHTKSTPTTSEDEGYHYAAKRTTTSTDEDSGNLTDQGDQSDLDIDTSLPPIIGAPPNEFNHPYDLKYTPMQKFWHGLRRSMTIFWTFIPFIRHYFWTHVLRYPGPQDRKDMLENLLVCLEASGCAFIKFGQWLSMRPDIFPLDVIEVLSRLRDGAPSHSYEETVEIIREEFGRDISDLFMSFEVDAIASGSIAQVYKARLLPEVAREFNIRNASGELVHDVAVKIRHPGVLSETWIDLDIIYAIVDRIPGLCIPFNKEELKLMIQYQIDFRFEGHYLSRFRRNFAEEIQQNYIAFPYVSEKSLRQSVLIESWASGSTVGDIFVEVGDMFRPIIRQMSQDKAPIRAHTPTLRDDAVKYIQYAKEGFRLAKGFLIDGLYSLADKYDIKVDHFNSLRHRKNTQLDNTFIANTLRKFLPPRGRIGEERYVWDSNLSDEENRRQEQKKILAYTLFDMFIKMFLRDNLIHADLHAGNVLYDNTGFNHTATVLDAGMTVQLEPDIMKQFGLFLRSICDGDADGLVEAVSRFEVNLPEPEKLRPLKPLKNDSSAVWDKLPLPIGSGLGHLATNAVIRSDFRRDIHSIFHRFYNNSAVWGKDSHDAENVSIGDVVGQVLLAMQNHGVILRGDVAASIMAMSIIEGLLRQLDPDLDIVVKAVPYFLVLRNQ